MNSLPYKDLCNHPIDDAFSSMPVPYLLNILSIGTGYYHIKQNLILNEAGIHNLDELKARERVPLYYGYSFVMSILRHSQDEHVGLVIGRAIQLQAFHVLGYLLMNCETLGEAIASILQYEKLTWEHSTTTLVQNGQDCRLIWHCPFAGDSARYFVEMIISGWIKHACAMTITNPTIKAVNFMHKQPADTRPYQAAYGGCAVNFNATENSVVFPAKSLTIAFHQYDAELKKILSRQALEQLKEFKQTVRFASAVRQTIFQLLQQEHLSLENVAQALALSPRALHNRLKKQNLTFQSLVDEVRQIIASLVIGNADVSLVELGYLLGFNDQSSFTRAFKRWHGETPGDFRRQMHALQNSRCMTTSTPVSFTYTTR